MDRLDAKILTELQANGRISHAELGRTIGLSSPAVAARIAKLEDAGVISGYTPQLSHEKVGYALSAFIIVTDPKVDFETALKILRAIDGITEIHRVTGNAFLIAKTVAVDMSGLNRVIDAVARVGTPSTSMILYSSDRHPIEPLIVNGG